MTEQAQTFLKRLLLAYMLAISTFVSVSNCALVRKGPDQPPSRSGQIAQAGRQVVAAAESVLNGVDVLVETGLLSKPDATNVVLKVRRIGEEGERLSRVLIVVELTQNIVEYEKGVLQAGEILKVIQRLVTEAGSDINNVESRQKVVADLNRISDAVVNAALVLP